MAAVTASVVRELAFTRGENDQIRAVIADVLGPASYTNTGGDGITVAGLSYILGAIRVAGGAGYYLSWDVTTQKMIYRWVDTTTDGAPMAEVTNATNLGAVASKVLFIGV
jgi:hypothetical protein